MIKYRFLVTLILLFLFSSTCAAAGQSILNEDSNGSTIIINEGESIKLNLDSNPSTGFSWQYFPNPRDSLLEETEHGYLPGLHPPGIVGADGKEFWTYKLAGSGVATLSLAYMQPWESLMPSKTFSVNIRITPQIKVLLDGKALDFDVPPLLEEDSLLAPVRTIFEALGAEVNWLPETQQVRAKKGDNVVELTVGSDTAFVNGSAVKLVLPLRYLVTGY